MNVSRKLSNYIRIAMLFSLIFLCNSGFISAQSNVFNKYGLQVINDPQILKNKIAADANKQMVDLKKFIPRITLDLKYATTDNFMHQKLYPPSAALFFVSLRQTR